MSAYNLAVAGGMPPATSLLLRRVLAFGGRPKAILVDFKSRQLSVDPRRIGEGFVALPNLPEALEICWQFRDAEFVTKLILSRTLTSYRDRRGLRSVIWRQVDREHSPPFIHWPPFWTNWCCIKGPSSARKTRSPFRRKGPRTSRSVRTDAVAGVY